MYTASPDLSIPPSVDVPSETTAHDPEKDWHAYRTFACKYCGTVHPYVALARCGDRTCTQCRKKDFYRLLRAYRPFVTGLQAHALRLVTALVPFDAEQHVFCI